MKGDLLYMARLPCLFCGIMMVLLIALASFAYYVFPEIGMVVHSQCANPTPNWNGKIMDLQIWESGFLNRNDTHNSYLDTTEDRRRRSLLLEHGFNVENTERILESITNRPDDPIIVWGSHHKTGTYVAQKAFSHMCKRMSWCCIFHVTRDSINVIKEVLQSEPIKVLGHTQWIWNPRELGIKHYRFVHFYRKPYKKIISGYRYHKDGAEAWCLKQSINYTKACDFSPARITDAIVPYKKRAEEHFIRGGADFTEPKEQEAKKVAAFMKQPKGLGAQLSRQTIQDYCHSIHLCEPCCRREHEVWGAQANAVKKSAKRKPPKAKNSNTTSTKANAKPAKNQSIGKNYTASAIASKNASSGDVVVEKKAVGTEKVAATTDAGTGVRALIVEVAGEEEEEGGHVGRELLVENSRVYAKNPQYVYDFQCQNLGPMSELSLTETLRQIPVVQGLRVEASIDYYETLRMARIYNETWNDPYSLNIDLDVLMKDYGGTMRVIISHLDLNLPRAEKRKLAKELDFYDVNESPIYRWTMTNPLVNHIDTKSASDPTDYVGILNSDLVIAHIYTDIHSLMYGAMHENGPPSAAMKRIQEGDKMAVWS